MYVFNIANDATPMLACMQFCHLYHNLINVFVVVAQKILEMSTFTLEGATLRVQPPRGLKPRKLLHVKVDFTEPQVATSKILFVVSSRQW